MVVCFVHPFPLPRLQQEMYTRRNGDPVAHCEPLIKKAGEVLLASGTRVATKEYLRPRGSSASVWRATARRGKVIEKKLKEPASPYTF